MAAADTCCMRSGWDLSFLDSEAAHRLHFARKGDFQQRRPAVSAAVTLCSSVSRSNPLDSVVRRSSNPAASASHQMSPQTTTSPGATSRSPDASLAPTNSADDSLDHVYENQAIPSSDDMRTMAKRAATSCSSSSCSSSSSEDDLLMTTTPPSDHNPQWHASIRCSFLQAPPSASICRSSRSPVAQTSVVFPPPLECNDLTAVLSQSHGDGDVYARVTRCLSFWDDDRLSTTFRRLGLCHFYLGKLSFDEAKVLLRRHPVGTFLLRDSSDERFAFALSVQTRRGTTSIRIVCESGGQFRLDCEPEQVHLMPTFDCVVALVQFYVHQGCRRTTPNNLVLQEMNGRRDLPVLLRRPYETTAPSLAHLCRKTINARIGGKSVSRLQLLPSLKDFLNDYPYDI